MGLGGLALVGLAGAVWCVIRIRDRFIIRHSAISTGAEVLKVRSGDQGGVAYKVRYTIRGEAYTRWIAVPPWSLREKSWHVANVGDSVRIVYRKDKPKRAYDPDDLSSIKMDLGLWLGVVFFGFFAALMLGYAMA